MFYFKIILSVFFFNNLLLFHLADGRISNEQKCVDEKCSVPISLAKTLLRYNSDDERILSFARNANVKIFSKEAGDKPDFWGAEIDGKRGYVPRGFLKEFKILVKKEDVNTVVSTGRDDEKLNATQHLLDKPSIVSSEHVVTPALPTVSSKGFFGIMGGVSADSVPMNSPDIKPQTTDQFQVFDGTTVYEDAASETTKSVIPDKDEASSPLKDPNFDNISKAKSVLSFKESINSIQKPIVSFAEQTAEKPAKENTVAVDDNSEQKEVLLESIPDAKEIHIEKSLDPTGSFTGKTVAEKENIDITIVDNVKNQIDNNVDSKEKAEENKVEGKENIHDNLISTVKEINKEDALVTPRIESSGIFGIFDQVTNFISSGTGEILENNSEDGGEGDSVNQVTQKVDVEVENEKESSGEAMHGENDFVSSDQNEISQKVKVPTKPGNEAGSTEPEHSDDTTKAPSLQEIVSLDNIGASINYSVESEEKFHSKASDIEDNSETSLGKEKDEPEHFVMNVEDKEYNPQDKKIPIFDTDIHIITGSNDNSDLEEKKLVDKSDDQLDIKNILNQQISEESRQLDDTIPTSAFQEGNKDLKTKTSEIPLKNEEKPTEIITESIVSVTSSESVVMSPFKSLFNDEVKDNTEGKSKVVQDVKPVYEEPESQQPNTNVDGKITTQPFRDPNSVEEVSTSESKEIKQDLPNIDTQPQEGSGFVVYKHPPVPPFFNERNILPKQEDVPMYSAVVKDETMVPLVEEKETLKTETTVSSEVVQDPVPDYDNKLEESQEESASNEIPPSDSFIDHGSVHEPLDEFVTEEKIEDSTTPSDLSDSEGLLSWLNPILELFSNSDKTKEDSMTEHLDEVSIFSDKLDNTLTSRIQEESCQAGGFGEENCGSLKPVNDPVEEAAKEDSWHQLTFLTDSVPATLELVERVPLEITVWLIVTAVVVLIFSLGHYYIEAHRRDGPLVAVINKLEREVLILQKESSILDDRLQTAQEQLEAWTTNSSENDALLVELKQELEDTRTAKADLEEQVAVLEREVETVTESGLEMHRLLSESLSSQDGSQVLLSTVETLREKLEHQENEISGLSQSLASKNTEVDELKEKLVEAAEVAVELENKIISLTRENQETVLELNDKHRLLSAQLEEVLETKALDETRVSTEMSKLRLAVEELQKLLGEKDSELEEVKEVVKQLRSTDSNEKMDALFDVVTVKAQLKAATLERDDFKEKFLEEDGARKLLEGHMKKITQEVAELKNSFETAEKEKIEALTRLQVLSDYFKEKEGQLQKELGMKESLWLQKQSEDHTIYEQMRSLREENEKYKLQNESLKKEIVEQESSFKIQLANVEQKSHENWVASRQAERRLKEVQQEAGQLRNRLTMEKTAVNFTSLDDSKQMNESNGDPSSPPSSLIFPPTTSPPFMMYPPGDFVPPPPLLSSPYPSDSRPPPLGRISSPPLDHRFSPPPPYPPYEPFPPYGHRSPSPPPPLPPYTHHRNVHKPQPREMPRDPKDHSMSNYSPENEKPSRRNKR